MTTPDRVTRYDLNDLPHFTATFVTTDNVTLADPSMVMFLLKNPSGVTATYTYTGGLGGGSITRLGPGQYVKNDVTLDQVGSWFYRWSGTGGIQANEEWSALVDQSFIL
jgi:hypothetical protein